MCIALIVKDLLDIKVYDLSMKFQLRVSYILVLRLVHELYG